MNDSLARLSSALAGRYVIEREVGVGGMARVYLAADLRHHRQVAIKVLKPELSEALGAERFLREIETSASLRHPHILPLFDSGETGESLFFVMPYVEGESLRARLDREPQLPIDEALQIAREVADALHYAHGKGVIHRDIKPENILLESGHAVVADFGIARAIRAVENPALTLTGSSLGTPRYMSPEQAAGDRDVDGRADQYSLACTLFEMLAGQPPFTGPTFERMIYQHVIETPPPVTRFRPTVPSGVAAAIERALAKSPADRYASTLGFIEAMRAPAAERSAPKSVAVLPFLSLSADPENEYFADGITEDVIAQLSKIRSLKVASRTSVMAFKGRDHDVREAASRLQVRVVLEGSVRRAGNRVRIAAQLIDAEADSHLWSETYDRELTDIFAIQTEVALNIAEALQAQLSPAERAKIRRLPTNDMTAYQLYVQGRGNLMRFTGEGFRSALAYFQQAVERDPRYAAAYAGIAQAYTELGETGEMIPEHAYPEAKAAAAKAIALDPDLAEGYTMDGYVKMTYDFDWAGAEASFRRAVALNPNNGDAYDLYGRLCGALERHDEAIAMQRRANEIDPIVNKTDVANAFLRAGRYEEAAEYALRAVEVDRDDPRCHFTLGWAYVGLGKVAEGLAAMERAVELSPGSTLWLAQLGEAYALNGRQAEAMGILERLREQAKVGYVSTYHLAYVYTGLGRYDEAMDCLEEAEAKRSGSIYGVKGSFLFKPLRDHPRFVALLARMHLT